MMPLPSLEEGSSTAGYFSSRALAPKAGLLLVGLDASGTEIPPWMNTPGAPFSNYGQPSIHEKEAIRWISANSGAPGNGISWSPLHKLEGIITPNGLHFERHHNGVSRQSIPSGIG
jgi:sulfane dehydrogenase subunit SoxC